MQNYVRCIGFILLFIFSWTDNLADPRDSTRSRRWFIPHFVPVQFAGNIGLFSTGAGYTSEKRNYQLSLLYGYVPRSVAMKDIHTITIKNQFPLGRYLLKNNQTVIPYLGVGLSVEVSGNAFFRMPDHFPEDYYAFPKNLHVIACGGVRLQHLFQDGTWLRGVEAFAEAGTIDVYLWYKTISRRIGFQDVFTLALGVNLLLQHE